MENGCATRAIELSNIQSKIGSLCSKYSLDNRQEVKDRLNVLLGQVGEYGKMIGHIIDELSEVLKDMERREIEWGEPQEN